MSKKILITGGTGFIGARTVRALKKKDHEVVLFKGDVRKVGDWEKNLKGSETVLHLAAVRTETKKDFDVNVTGTENLFKAITRLNKLPKRVILASSQAVYMGCRIPFKESTKPVPTTVYGKSKLESEKVAQKWAKKLKTPLIILRYSTVLGPGVRKKSHMSGPLFTWTQAGLAGKSIKVFQDGKQTRDYIHVDDLVLANIFAIESLTSGIYNIGGDKKVRLIDFANWVAEATGAESEVLIVGGEAGPSDPRHLFSNTEKLKKYGWKPKKTVKQAVYEFVHFMRQQKKRGAL